MASLQKGAPPSADFFMTNCPPPPTTSNRGKLTHASSRHWSPHARPQAFAFSAVHSSKASTMDGDKRRYVLIYLRFSVAKLLTIISHFLWRLFLDRMKANPLFKRANKTNPPLSSNNKSTGVEILTDDEVGTVSSEDPHGHMSLFLHHQHEQQTQHFQRHPQAVASFDLKNGGPVHFGFRSLSSDARTGPKSSCPSTSVTTSGATVTPSSSAIGTLFAGEDDPPLLMSSIDGVTTQVCSTTTKTHLDTPRIYLMALDLSISFFVL